ncbi:MAG TPA: OmpA family protein [Candidatus Deferrimicrobiaceae bacterium]
MGRCGVAVLVLLGACAAAPPAAPPPGRNVFILLPDDQGKTGALVVSAAGNDRVLDAPGQAVRIAPGAAPGQPFTMSGAEIAELFGPALSALPKAPAQFILYFDRDSAELTRPSAGRVPDIVRAIRERSSVDVSVVGHADTLGDRRHNAQLSMKRARAVGDLLAAEGVDSSILEITSHGKDNPLIPTGDQVSEPRNRRVEVTVR